MAVAKMVYFTDNYTDRSTENGYQFEFHCERCGNGYTSSFQHSVAGFGGKLLQMGGDLLGGQVGSKASQLGWDAQWMRGYGSERGSTRDKMLAKAVEEVSPQFTQCHRCGQWVCNQICWNSERGMCTTCAPKLDQEIAGMQAAAQVDQLNQRSASRTGPRGSTTVRRPPAGAPRAAATAAAGSSAATAAPRRPAG